MSKINELKRLRYKIQETADPTTERSEGGVLDDDNDRSLWSRARGAPRCPGGLQGRTHSPADTSDRVGIGACGKCGKVQSEIQRTFSKMLKK